MTAELAVRPRWVDPPSRDEWESYRNQCVVIAESGLMPPGLNGRPKAVMTVMLKGRELGLTPLVACSELHIIEGKVGMSAALQQALVRSVGHEVWVDDESDDEHAIVYGIRLGSERELRAAFTLEQARRAGKLEPSRSGKPTGWQTYPEDMLVARAYSRLFRRNFADVLLGVAGTPDELGATELTDGSVEYPAAGPARRVTATVIREPALSLAEQACARCGALPGQEHTSECLAASYAEQRAKLDQQVQEDLALFGGGKDWRDYAGSNVRRRTKLQMAADRLADAERAGHPAVQQEDPLAGRDPGIPDHPDVEPLAAVAVPAAPEPVLVPCVLDHAADEDGGGPLHDGPCQPGTVDDFLAAAGDPIPAVGDVLGDAADDLAGDPLGGADPLEGVPAFGGANLPDSGLPDDVPVPAGSAPVEPEPSAEQRTVEELLAEIDAAALVLGKSRSQLMVKWIAAHRKNPEEATPDELARYLVSIEPYVQAARVKGAPE